MREAYQGQGASGRPDDRSTKTILRGRRRRRRRTPALRPSSGRIAASTSCRNVAGHAFVPPADGACVVG